ncbi:DUF6249 domain-containing protein [Oligoflexus tunisiensis]|uniref:DUF6249 domain-containing protein n=1 Tax=Oligoflexus tunisiensis TaxID=708132 RepID=UPI000B2D4704|nr:DUF6249 domain-containing protein [Oligoflexus tunisiensis]
MKRYLPPLILILLTSLSGLGFGQATEIEQRQGVLSEPPSPSESENNDPTDVVVLGSMKLPVEVVKKLDSKQLADILERQAMAPKSTVQHIFNESFLVPAVVFGSFTIISFLILYYSYRKRREMLDTVRVAIQSGQTLPASFLEALESKPRPTPDSDLRKAVLLMALGLSGMGVLAALTDEEAGRAWSIGLVPTLLGIGYLFLWRQSQKRLKAGSPDEPR